MTRPIIEAVIFDWAGTTVDFGSLAPAAAFAAIFDEAGVPVSDDEIRRWMGLDKRRHLEEMLKDPSIVGRWRSVHAEPPTEADVDRLYVAFVARLTESLPAFADPIPGVVETVDGLRAAGVKIGSNSGYSAAMMDVLARAARDRGFAPDCCVSSSDVAAGRPAPDLALKCLTLLGLDRPSRAIKVDDTPAGIEEGRNAGMWTVGIAVSGNEVGLSLASWAALPEREQTLLRAQANDRLRAAGAHYVIDTVADMRDVLAAVEARIVAGERPMAP